MPIPEPKKNIRSKTAKERIYDQLKQWIVEGTLAPNEKLSDQEVSSYFSVSRTPVREAIQQLAEEKLVIIEPGKTTQIAPIDHKTVHAAYQLNADLNALALEYAWDHLSDRSLNEMEKWNEKIEEASQLHDIQGVLENDQKFHKVLFSLSNNIFLLEMYELLNAHCLRVEYMYFKDIRHSKDSYTEHKKILDALRNRDIETAKKCMRDNWKDTLRILGDRF